MKVVQSPVFALSGVTGFRGCVPAHSRFRVRTHSTTEASTGFGFSSLSSSSRTASSSSSSAPSSRLSSSSSSSLSPSSSSSSWSSSSSLLSSSLGLPSTSAVNSCGKDRKLGRRCLHQSAASNIYLGASLCHYPPSKAYLPTRHPQLRIRARRRSGVDCIDSAHFSSARSAVNLKDEADDEEEARLRRARDISLSFDPSSSSTSDPSADAATRLDPLLNSSSSGSGPNPRHVQPAEPGNLAAALGADAPPEENGRLSSRDRAINDLLRAYGEDEFVVKPSSTPSSSDPERYQPESSRTNATSKRPAPLAPGADESEAPSASRSREPPESEEIDRLALHWSGEGSVADNTPSVKQIHGIIGDKRKSSRTEDYDLWHNWSGNSDKPETEAHNPSVLEAESSVMQTNGKAARRVRRERDASRDSLLGAENEHSSTPAASILSSTISNEKEELPSMGRAGETVQSAPKAATASPDASTSSSAHNQSPNAIQSPSSPLNGTDAYAREVAELRAKAASLYQDISAQAANHTSTVRAHAKTLAARLADRARGWTRRLEREFGLLGGKINGVTGYDEVERLKSEVVKRELEIARLRQVAGTAKKTYDEAVTIRSTTQRDIQSLLERKDSWSDADVLRFTKLVRSGHTTNAAVAESKEALQVADVEVERAFDALMKAILERYHEEQVWSDKIRSVSTYGSLAVLVVNLIVFLGATAVIEPWKRRRLVVGLEERVKSWVEEVEQGVHQELQEMKGLVATSFASLTPPVPQPMATAANKEIPSTDTQTQPDSALSETPTRAISILEGIQAWSDAHTPYLSPYIPADTPASRTAIAVMGGYAAGALFTTLMNLMTSR